MVNGSPPAASCKDHCLAPFLHLQNREAGSHTGCCTTGGLPLKEGPIYLGLILDITLLISSYLVQDYLRHVGIIVHMAPSFSA